MPEQKLQVSNMSGDTVSNNVQQDNFLRTEELQKINHNKFLQPLSQEDIDKNLKATKEANKACSVIVVFCNQIYSAIHPDLLSDKKANLRTCKIRVLIATQMFITLVCQDIYSLTLPNL